MSLLQNALIIRSRPAIDSASSGAHSNQGSQPRASTIRMNLPPPRRYRVTFAASLGLLVLLSTLAIAQKLPPPSRTVYKCTVDGKTLYSDSPCLGAERLEIEPTRGLDKSSGRSRIGGEVRREKHREDMADALRPITGMSTKQFDQYGKRSQLSPESQRECRNLDIAAHTTESEEKRVSKPELPSVQKRLLVIRQRLRELGC